MIGRIVLTVVVLSAFGAAGYAYLAGETVALGHVAGSQFDNSDQAAITAQAAFGSVRFIAASAAVVALLLLAAIWCGPIRKALAAISAGALALAVVLTPRPAAAYYNQTDWPDIYFVKPNETAFFVPDTGANLNSQTKMDSEEYYKANKISAKRFTIPHSKLPGSGWAFGGYYVPDGRLFIVDRTLYYSEWTHSEGRGTSARDEAIYCQTSEGLNVRVEIGLSADIKDEDAPRYLHSFGVQLPPGDPGDPRVIFTSVYQARPLPTVIDTVVRGRVATLICAGIGARTLEKANAEAADIMKEVEKGARAFMAENGISLQYIGYAGTWDFDPDVQAAINRKFDASQDRAVATSLQPYAETLQQLAIAQAIRAAGDKFDGKLPASLSGLIITPGLLSDLARQLAPSK